MSLSTARSRRLRRRSTYGQHSGDRDRDRFSGRRRIGLGHSHAEIHGILEHDSILIVHAHGVQPSHVTDLSRSSRSASGMLRFGMRPV
jgi:hypothetical protein